MTTDHLTEQRTPPPTERSPLPKTPTGIAGLDQITDGGLPTGRPTLVCGGPGCGKTLLAMEFLVRGARDYDEPGVMVSFEETGPELIKNVASLGFDVRALVEQGRLLFDHVKVDRNEIEETGAFDLDGLFIRIGYAAEQVGARRVVLDTVESLFSAFSNEVILRSELRRLFAWLKDRGLTAVITGEQGEGTLTRNGLEEYVSDCVIFLDHRTDGDISTRRMRIVKYRGSRHGTNQYPYLISDDGFTVVPITSMTLEHPASTEHVSSGVARLDTMLDGSGIYRGSSVLVSGSAGTGKTSLLAHFVDAACRRGERCIWFAFEESPAQIVRNMGSIGFDLDRWVNEGLLRFEAVRPTRGGLESHLASVHLTIDAFDPTTVVVDPVTNLSWVGSENDVKRMLMQIVDLLKNREITAMFTALTEIGEEMSGVGVSSLMDVWILLRNSEMSGERNRLLFLLKARGMAHSNQVREFVLTDAGVQLVDVAVGAEGVLTGSARVAAGARARAVETTRREEFAIKRRRLERRRRVLESQIAAIRAEIEDEADEARFTDTVEDERVSEVAADRRLMAASRHADEPGASVDEESSVPRQHRAQEVDQ